jgi:diadenylate cyclase
VSEERGSISFCFNGNIIANLDGPRLRAALDGIFRPKRATNRKTPQWFGFLFRKPKAAEKPASVRQPLERAVGPLSTRTPLRHKTADNAAITSLGERSTRSYVPKVPTGHQIVEPLRKRAKSGEPQEPKSELNIDPSLSPTATPIRTRPSVPGDEGRVSLLAEAPLVPSKRPRDSAPPPDASRVLGTPLPQSRSGNPAAPELPLRHLINRSSMASHNPNGEAQDRSIEHVMDSSKTSDSPSQRSAAPQAEEDCGEVPTTARVVQKVETEGESSTRDHQEPAP